MKKKPTKIVDKPFNEQLILEYLQDNPDFFNRHPELLISLRIPHSPRGTVSLVEKRQQLLREKVAQLEEEITNLLTIATRNERIYRLNMALTRKLIGCTSEAEIYRVLSEQLINYFDFSHVRLIKVSHESTELTKICRKRLQFGHYFGRLPIMESRIVFGNEVGSVLLSKLTVHKDTFLLAIASPDAMHFNPEMDSMLFEELQQVLEHLLTKFK